jgi:DCC-interacting protein 13 alpha
MTTSPSIKFELDPTLKDQVTRQLITNTQRLALKVKPEQGDVFKVKFIGTMNVRSDKGNDYIHETIRQVVKKRNELGDKEATLVEYNLIVNRASISLFSIPSEKEVAEPDSLKAKFNLSDLAFWSTLKENKKLFGFIIKQSSHHSFKFVSYIFKTEDYEADVICDSIVKATELAFKLLMVYLDWN